MIKFLIVFEATTEDDFTTCREVETGLTYLLEMIDANTSFVSLTDDGVNVSRVGGQ